MKLNKRLKLMLRVVVYVVYMTLNFQTGLPVFEVRVMGFYVSHGAEFVPSVDGLLLNLF